MRWWWWIVLLIAAPAAAHTRSESHSSWMIDGTTVHLDFSVPDIEARRLTPDGAPPANKTLIAYLEGHVAVLNGEHRCPLAARPRAVAAVAGYRRLEFGFSCPSVDAMVLRSDAFFELVPTHVTFAQIQDAKGDFFEQLITTDARTIAVSGRSGGDRLENAGFLDYVRMGVMHIFTGIDHMSFLVGLVLISRRFRDLLFVVTGFTIGHSLTLALAVTGLVRPHAEFIDALVALTIALIGVENISVATRRPGLIALWSGGALLAMTALRIAGIGVLPVALLLGAAIFTANYIMVSGHVRDAGRLRLVVTLVFGLIHGFGFAADLLESRIPTAKLAELLVGFNLGVEVGQLSVVTAIVGGALLMVRLKLAPPRPIVVDVAASALVCLGTYWFVSRSFV